MGDSSPRSQEVTAEDPEQTLQVVLGKARTKNASQPLLRAVRICAAFAETLPRLSYSEFRNEHLGLA